jgi:hypothetical protein
MWRLTNPPTAKASVQNAQTAKIIGLDIPNQLLALADDMIE